MRQAQLFIIVPIYRHRNSNTEKLGNLSKARTAKTKPGIKPSHAFIY